VQVVLYKMKMDYNYYDEIIKKVLELEKQNEIKITRSIDIQIEDLKTFNNFPKDIKYFLNKIGFVEISSQNNYSIISIMIEEIENSDFDFLDSWSNNLSFRKIF
jgi:hypothetical protein